MDETTPRPAEEEAPEKKRRSWVSRFLPWPTILCLALTAYIFLFSENSIVTRMKYESTIDSLNMELAAQRDTMLYFKQLNENLRRDPEVIEQVVREQYNMKRPNEDVFLVQEPDQIK